MILGDTILETRGLTREFKGFIAVNGVNLRVRRGSIHALIGPNGAGKTTCFNLLTKFLEPTAGQIVFNGIDITNERPAQIARRGIIRSFQISAVFPHLTALQNVRIGLQRVLGTAFHFWKSERTLHQLDDRAMDLLTQVGLTDFADVVEVAYRYVDPVVVVFAAGFQEQDLDFRVFREAVGEDATCCAGAYYDVVEFAFQAGGCFFCDAHGFVS